MREAVRVLIKRNCFVHNVTGFFEHKAAYVVHNVIIYDKHNYTGLTAGLSSRVEVTFLIQLSL
jgi:hypothetical protein